MENYDNRSAWESVENYDNDEGTLVDNNGRQPKRDFVQFVQFHRSVGDKLVENYPGIIYSFLYYMYTVSSLDDDDNS